MFISYHGTETGKVIEWPDNYGNIHHVTVVCCQVLVDPCKGKGYLWKNELLWGKSMEYDIQDGLHLFVCRLVTAVYPT